MASNEFKDAHATVVTGSFAARAALYEHLFHFEQSVLVEKSFACLDGKDAVVVVCNNAYGLPSLAAKEVMACVLHPIAAPRAPH